MGDADWRDSSVREVKWNTLPEGLSVMPKPIKLDESLVQGLIFMRWEAPWGWFLGTISEMLTAATPRLLKRFNYRVTWSDGMKGTAKLILDNYAHGPSAPHNSWCLLQKD